jgi:uncharacterized protein YqeY
MYLVSFNKGKQTMSLITKIQDDLLSLRKEGTDKAAISLLTTLYSEAANIGINDGKRVTTDPEVMAVIKKFIKGIDECLQHATDKEPYLKEKSILEKYLPSQMNETELKSAISTFILSRGNSTKADVMKYLKSAYTGKYDGKLASTLADSIIGA